ncbi:MAG: ABC transporter ATP-binding protein [Hydrogenibacillus schlegelii]|nr:ABC transporter ATP-binding protein [Hydrogenibacillus schlegelii]
MRDDGMTQSEILAVRRIGASVGGRALFSDLDWALYPGEVWAVVGPNGAGKTTFLALLAGLRRPDAGEVTLRGRPLRRLRREEIARHVAYVPQSPGSGPLSLEEFLALGGLASGLAGAALRRRVEQAAERFGLGGRLKLPVQALSGGERRRAYLARAEVQDAAAYLLDEPTADLDVRAAWEMFGRIRAWAAEGRGVVFVTHDVNAAALVADRVLLFGGRRGASSPAAEQGRPSPAAEVGLPDRGPAPTPAVLHPAALQAAAIEGVFGLRPVPIRHPLADVPQFLYPPIRPGPY